MAGEHYLHVAFNFEGRPAKASELEPAFNLAIDWVRYAPNCWVIYTRRSPAEWYKTLKPRLHPEDGILIIEVSPKSRYGFLENWIWEWFDKRQ